MIPKFYECDICGHCHPWDWDGDCRENSNRFTNDELDRRYKADGYELASMDERLAADLGEE